MGRLHVCGLSFYGSRLVARANIFGRTVLLRSIRPGVDMGQAGRNLDVGHLEGGQGTCLDFGQSEGSATCSMLLWGTSTKSLYTL